MFFTLMIFFIESILSCMTRTRHSIDSVKRSTKRYFKMGKESNSSPEKPQSTTEIESLNESHIAPPCLEPSPPPLGGVGQFMKIITPTRDLQFKELCISRTTFDTFFEMKIDGVRHNLFQCHICAYILFQKYRMEIGKRFSNSEISKRNVFCIAYLVSLKIIDDQIDFRIDDFTELFGLQEPTYSEKIYQYESQFCKAIHWSMFISNDVYLQYTKKLHDIIGIKNAILEF